MTRTQTEQARDARTALIDVAVDFETFYDREYTLKKLTTAEYIRDPRFQVIGVSLVLGGLPAWYSGSHEYLGQLLGRIPWHRCRFIAHNAMFDGAILEWVFALRPARYFCSMMGARPFVAPKLGTTALGKVLPYLELGEKGTAVHDFIGRRRETFTPEELKAYGQYSKGDAVGSLRIAEHMCRLLPEEEQDLIDLTIKKFTRPTLRIDRAVIANRLAELTAQRAQVLTDLAPLGVTKSRLTSRPQFAQLLETCGVAAPMKASVADPTEETYAFAKQDLAFMELLTHPDERVRKLVEARLMFASNLEQSRLEKFDRLAQLTDTQELAVPLLYYGAHPGRFSGFDALNLQNLPRVNKKKAGSGSLRQALVAPPGYVVLAADLSNIEARILAALASQQNLLTLFRNKGDPYCDFGTDFYRRRITKADELERFVSKTCVLGLGYGMGAPKLRFTLAIAPTPVQLSEEAARDAVRFYRDKKYPRIPELWATLENILPRCTDRKFMYVHGPLRFLHERIILPNGMPIWYPGLRFDPAEHAFGYDRPKVGFSSLWGGAITENVVQALARIVISTAELRLARAGLRAALQVHDELVFVVREEHVEACRMAVELALTAPVDWMPELPIACEIKYGRSYADAK